MASTVSTQRAVPRAEHVGSLLRPERLKETKATDRTRLTEVEDECILAAIRRQLELGLDVVTDGEMRRRYFQSSWDDAVTGYVESGDPPQFFTNDKGEKVQLPTPRIVGGRLERTDSLSVREVSFLREMTDARIKATFPAPSAKLGPHVFRPGTSDAYYADPDELADHVAQLLREFLLETIEAGADYVQLDFPPYTMAATLPDWAERVRGMGSDPDALLERWSRADRAVVADLPDHVRTAMHLCRGNFRGARAAQGSIEPLAERIFSLPYDSFLVEWDDVSRTGDFSALRHVPSPGPVIVLGLVSTKLPELEAEDDVVRRVEEAARLLPIEQLAVSPQCGFASEEAGNPGMTEDVQWRKLELVARAADRIWGR